MDLKNKILNCFIFGFVALSSASTVYLLARDIHDTRTADVIVHQNSKINPPLGRKLLGFDRDNNGEIDEIREYSAYFGAKASTQIFRKYTLKILLFKN